MGQKINPTIFRLSHTNKWKFNYIEKKSTESSFYNYQDIEIRKFIIKFFAFYGLVVQDLKLNYSNNLLQIFVTYSSSSKLSFLIFGVNKKQKLQIVKKKIKKNNLKKIVFENMTSYKDIKKCGHYLKNSPTVLKQKKTNKFRRTKLLNYVKTALLIQRYKTLYSIKKNFFLYKFFENLTTFTKKRLNIFLTIKQINKSVQHEFTKKSIQVLKKHLVKLRRYENNYFFKEGLNILFLCSTKKDSAKLLSSFIAIQLKKLKRHNFFLKFLKSVLTIFINKKFSTLQGIKIKISGRFNKAPRARSKTLIIGNEIPILTLKSQLDYSETTSFTPNGTFGVKVWICQKQ